MAVSPRRSSSSAAAYTVKGLQENTSIGAHVGAVGRMPGVALG